MLLVAGNWLPRISRINTNKKNNYLQFWFSYRDTDDEKLLEETFEKYNDLLDSFGAALKNIPLKTEETFEEYFKRIMQITKDKRKM
jgi:hypothetical protein